MTELILPHRYAPRDYQVPFLRAMDAGYKRAVCVWHRRSGKDKTFLNFTIKKTQERVGGYYYFFPEFAQGRAVLWDGLDKDGVPFLDHIPAGLIESKNNTEMKIIFKNGSIFRVIGTDNYNSKMGTNPVGCAYAEYSLQNPMARSLLRPILAENGGWEIFNFTPRGENHAYDLWKMAKSDPKNWFTQLLTVDDTRAIPQNVLDQERREIIALHGNDALFQQEYYCNFTVPIAGAYYADQIMQAYQDARVTSVPHDSSHAVDTWWDIGVGDSTSIWFTQSIGAEVRVIDFYESQGHGLPHYAQVLQEKARDFGYVYRRHTAPHDIANREWSSGQDRKSTAARLGVNFQVCPNVRLEDGIDAARRLLDRCRFDSERCSEGLNALKNYHKQFDENRKTYLNAPYHDWSSHAADAFRYLAIGIRQDAGQMIRKKVDRYEEEDESEITADTV